MTEQVIQPSPTAVTMTTSDAMKVLTNLSPTSYRTDDVWVLCDSNAERELISNAAQRALVDGYVKTVSQTTDDDTRVYIEFHKPPHLA